LDLRWNAVCEQAARDGGRPAIRLKGIELGHNFDGQRFVR
jgi:hypothetical protein